MFIVCVLFSSKFGPSSDGLLWSDNPDFISGSVPVVDHKPTRSYGGSQIKR